jgi:DNA-directed RNA polymerase specialized sigma24 family protein
MQRTWERDDLKDLDRAVRARLDTGDERGAVGLVVERLGPSIHAYLRTLLLEDEAAEAYPDFQENLLKSLSSFRWECPLRAWGHRLAFHAAARIWRRPGRRLEEPLPSSPSRLGPASRRSEQGMSGRHAGLALLRASLSVEDQTLLTLRIDRELEWEEIAAVFAERAGGDPGRTARGAGAGGIGPYTREAAALRKRYERLTRRLREEALHHGLID